MRYIYFTFTLFLTTSVFSQNVGIGVFDPAANLEVAGDILTDSIRVGDPIIDYGNNPIFSMGGSGSFSIDAPGSPGGRFFINQLGMVGIGNSDPMFHLDIEGDLEATEIHAGAIHANQINAEYEINTNEINADQATIYGLIAQIMGAPTLIAGTAEIDQLQVDEIMVEDITSEYIEAGELGVTGLLSVKQNASFSVDAPGIPEGRFVIRPDGKVGIGIQNPVTTLDVVGNIRGTSILATDLSTALIFAQTISTENMLADSMETQFIQGEFIQTESMLADSIETGDIVADSIQAGSMLAYSIQTASMQAADIVAESLHMTGNPSLIMDGGGTSGARFIVESNTGDVGIGIADPIVKLDVNGDVRTNGKVGIGLQNATHQLMVAGATSNLVRIGDISSNYGNNTLFSMSGTGAFAIDAVGIAGGRFFINGTNGNVGIGNNNPSEKLDVTGNLKLTGNIIVESATNADYLPGWTTYAVYNSPVRYYKDKIGVVHLEGICEGNLFNEIFQLPSGYRPMHTTVVSAGGFPNTAYRVTIAPDGIVSVENSTNWISLDNITFRAQ